MEGGGAATQGGVGYQDQVAALYMGRMLDQRPRPPKDRPESVRVEATSAVDDALVVMADGRRLFIQAKRALATSGDAWTGMWKAFANQATTDFHPGDSLSLAIGETTTVATRLREICTRSNESNVVEWRQRLSESQRRLADAIAAALGGDDALALHVCRQLDVHIWPAEGLARDYAPLWMPACDQSPDKLHAVLTGIALEGAATRQRFAPAELYDRLRADWDIRIDSPESWGAARYRGAIARSAVVTLPGTGFSQPIGDDFLWPRCLPYDRDRKPDFDDDAPRWRQAGESAAETLQKFPGADLDSVVLIAGPGFGKSTLIQAIAARLANDGLLPAIIRIPELADAGSGIAEFLANEVNAAFEVGIDWATAAGAGTLVLLLDGLDEVSGSRRTAVLQKLSDYRASSPQVRWLMTVRDPAALAMPEGVRILELAPLSDEEIDRYVEFYRPGEPALPALIRERLRGRPDLNRLVRIPIFIALMLVLRQEERNISRSDLLETYLEVLFNPKDYKASQDEAVDPTILRNIAERAAFEALEDDDVSIDAQALDGCAHHLAPEVGPDVVRRSLLSRGVIRRVNAVRFDFPFPIVQEFLASTELLRNHAPELEARLAMIAHRPWAQAIQFALERHPHPEPLVRHMLSTTDDAFHTALRLTGRCVSNGMRLPTGLRNEVGDRLVAIWGRTSWRTAELVAGIIIDAFSQPLHPAVRERLGDRHLIHHGSGAILARHRDHGLTLDVMARLLAGNIDHMLNIGELQGEVNRIGGPVFAMYVGAALTNPSDGAFGAIAALISHMGRGSVPEVDAHDAFLNEKLPIVIRLAAWVHTNAPVDDVIEGLISEALRVDDYEHRSSAARALSVPAMSTEAVLRLLLDPNLEDEARENALDYLLADWLRSKERGRIEKLARDKSLPNALRDRAALFALAAGAGELIDPLVERMSATDAQMVAAVAIMFGHVLRRGPVERAVELIEARDWSPADRLMIAHSLITGLTYRMEMFSFRSGSLHPIPPHPGRAIPLDLIGQWLSLGGYTARERLSLVLDAIGIGASSASDLSVLLEEALKEPADSHLADAATAGRAIEELEKGPNRLTLSRLLELLAEEDYNMSSSAARVIAGRGTREAADALIRAYGPLKDGHLKGVVLDALEPLAGRLGLRVTREGKELRAVSSR
ncbi:NACHT domain-containing protein [Aurantiacibacter suaedae]|uniref:NACHT domain-containing protein n=1 Tax=Aurantiacibacter suaedae TaxID=2545755 RepID=UPI0010F74BFA|nr:NACHT domain-containing protein [Aurantiacibacter suaedae]